LLLGEVRYAAQVPEHGGRTRYGFAIRTEREEHPGGWTGAMCSKAAVYTYGEVDARPIRELLATYEEDRNGEEQRQGEPERDSQGSG
jgi:hypothetical protein